MIRIIKSLLPLFVVQFFTWLALFSLWIYSTPVITRYIFHSTDSESPAFENGVNWVGICFAFYATLAALLAFFIPKLLRYTTKKRLHSIALLIGSIGLGLVGFIKNQYLLLISFAFIGIAWSSISNVPYSIVGDKAPEKEMATYFTIFNFSIVIPQITAAFLLGYINKHFFAGATIDIILLGACSMFLAGVTMLFTKY
ncbi:MFS transporter [Flavisolibacter ginsengisoli]|jgi:maltose/moltooligosaccharide transporter|uniref:Major Facilitator Superfamily protein n=1 Tax=Flavisolibacter ginsengisoli DSM 18119 TaxID=1121884 RepID=A0A1M4ZM21_9BACT|nr:MFS transporter [Flavisolibacter ginsengisoli]SHF19093.1 Major Facilitator Superfamily protein [Flavisolibacter ginsengisoli DSM 18119]